MTWLTSCMRSPPVGSGPSDGFAAVVQFAQPSHGTGGGQARCEGVRLGVEVIGDGRGQDALRGRVGGAGQAAEPVVLTDQAGAQRPCAPVVVVGEQQVVLGGEVDRDSARREGS
jgi:hypothetical protein